VHGFVCLSLVAVLLLLPCPARLLRLTFLFLSLETTRAVSFNTAFKAGRL